MSTIIGMSTLIGRGHPEATVKALAGSLYLDCDSGLFYWKDSSASDQDANNWVEAGASSRDYSFPDGASVVDVSGYKRYRTSNNTITNFTGGRDQQVIFLIVDRNTTIQANANIADGFVGPSRVSYMLDGGQWHMVVTRGLA